MIWIIENVENNNSANVSMEGVFSTDDQFRMLEELVARDFWKPDINVLFDCRKIDFSATNLEITKQASINFIAHDALIGCGKIALLMKSVVDFGKGRQFEILTDEKVCSNVGIFLNEAQAIRWLHS